MKLDKRIKVYISNEELKQYIDTHQHLTLPAIAHNLRMSVPTLRKKMLDLSIVKKHAGKGANKVDIKQFKEFVMSNPSAKKTEIAKALGITRQSVAYNLKKIGIQKIYRSSQYR